MTSRERTQIGCVAASIDAMRSEMAKNHEAVIVHIQKFEDCREDVGRHELILNGKPGEEKRAPGLVRRVDEQDSRLDTLDRSRRTFNKAIWTAWAAIAAGFGTWLKGWLLASK